MIFNYNGDILDPQCVTKTEPQVSKKDTVTRKSDLDTDSTGSPCNIGIRRSMRCSRCSGGGDDDSVYVHIMMSFLIYLK